MATSEAETVEAYLESLPPDRWEAISTLRSVIREHLPDGYEEVMQYGMISYVVPLARYPTTYNKQPLAYVSLASQKNYMSLYLMAVYADPEKLEQFASEWRTSGKKLDMGKSCVRFRRIDAIPLDVVARSVASTSVDEFIRLHERARS